MPKIHNLLKNNKSPGKNVLMKFIFLFLLNIKGAIFVTQISAGSKSGKKLSNFRQLMYLHLNNCLFA
ncbi:hypothetical protein BpHYR1_028804 [Brachionus plicatilis]|uniref:Uncharacterized protein n=1 Tax=Brachionus plicatilis TaxID=10195 RepID=A0A3M7P931_BRAPC|nr:hypothetical protein BpHYR1_028804 [Brachionus plicatilis]